MKFLGKRYLMDANEIRIDLTKRNASFRWHPKPKFIEAVLNGTLEMILPFFFGGLIYFVILNLIGHLFGYALNIAIILNSLLVFATILMIMEGWWIKFNHPKFWSKREDYLQKILPYINPLSYFLRKQALNKKINITQYCKKRKVGIEIPFQNTLMILEPEGEYKKYLKKVTWTKTNVKEGICKYGNFVVLEKANLKFRIFLEFSRIPKSGRFLMAHD